MFDTSHPMLRPLWVRLLICTLCLSWAGVELHLGNDTWAMIFGGLGAYCVYLLLIVYVPTADETDNDLDKQP
ncbi:hypothetical protein [Cohaesibacter celericrescens]|uniref:DUF3329 domain-containing protein n=1 Tax=Cohaesibacter celericrescens TaxID=2067669 RepID=A0A2N5XN78_9HYPH|nr:hypothetical protein [Cohaesibacter celericrescens]PLW76001.1 hypothetical protein C0081_18065 [Cohaesibacter celericrescens]